MTARVFSSSVEKFFATKRSFTCSSWLSDACKSSADQKIELLIFEKLSNAFPAAVFTDTGVNDFD